MKRIQFGNKIINIPTQYSELSTTQLVRTVELQNAQLTLTQFNVLQILNLLNIESRPWLKWYFFKNEYLIPFLDKLTFGKFTWTISAFTPEDFHELCQLSVPFHNQDNYPLDNPFPEISILGKGRFSGPEKIFANLTFRQFRKCEEYFSRFFQTNNSEDLNKFIAWLYLYKSKDSKEQLSITNTVIRSSSFEKMNINKKLTILYFYLATRDKVINLYPYLYAKTGLKPQKRTSNQIKTDFERSVRILSGNITKDEFTDLQNVHDALSHLNDKAKEAHDLEQYYKDNKK